MKIDPNFSAAYNYDDVFIVPKFSDIKSRTNVDITTRVESKTWNVPIMPANMLSVMTDDMARAVLSTGGIAALHRFQTIEEACIQFQKLHDFYNDEIVSNNVFVSVGVNRDSMERTDTLYSVGARNFIIDIAHGHSQQMVDMIKWVKSRHKNAYIMAGNVATADGVMTLANAGADAVKIGIAGGAVCTTKNVTGVTVPMVSSITNCVIGKRLIEASLNKSIALVADGGIREIGDVCKAIALGADLVMAGKLFVACNEALKPGEYSGSASDSVQSIYRTDKETLPTPEGASVVFEPTNQSASQVVEHIAGGLRSSCSYVGASTIKQFQDLATFGIRHNK